MDEADLREAHATLTRILGAIEEYVYTGEFLDDGGYQVVFAGPCREQFLGVTAEEAKTAIWRYYVHPEDTGLFDRAHDGALADGRLDVEYRLVGADGVLRWVRDRGRVRHEDGRRFLDGSILDTTEVRVMQQELAAARADAERLAHVDHLTGVQNRRALDGVQAAERPSGLLLVDIDHFKRINDEHGHHAGDEMLVAVADRLRSSIRTTDTILRMGGEEFLLAVHGLTTLDALGIVAETVRRSVDDLAVTVSVGAVLLRAADDFAVRLRDVDAALYAAKQAGRDQVSVAA
jgi:diguanylate cyclase (GGDEF)-like protein